MGSTGPDITTFPYFRDVSMNNLAIGTIWFRDGTSLSSLNDIRALTADGALTGPVTDPTNWTAWPISMIAIGILGLMLSTRVWNAKPTKAKDKKTA